MKTSLSALCFALALAGCQSSTPAPAEKPPEFDNYAAQQMLTRTLQAIENKDLAGVEADLFPRNRNTLAACAKTRLALNRAVAVGMEDGGGAPPKVSGVSLTNVQPQGNAYLATYQSQGNTGFSGQEMFVFANGRWWIKCQM